MKKSVRLLFCCLCVVVLFSTSVFGTMAYLTDRASATNTFTVGDVAITVDETDVDLSGKEIPGSDRVTENDYKLIPAATYTKDPTMTLKQGSEDSYVRMLVTITKYDELQKIFEGKFLPQDFVQGWDPALWISTEVVEVSDDGKEATYEFRYHKVVGPAVNADIVLEPLFTSFTVPGTLTNENLDAIKDMQIKVYGEAIQSLGFANETEAWAAFAEQNNP